MTILEILQQQLADLNSDKTEIEKEIEIVKMCINKQRERLNEETTICDCDHPTKHNTDNTLCGICNKIVGC